MDHVAPAAEYAASPAVMSGHNEAHSSGVSWAAVFGGAFVAAALAVSLLALGAGLGLSAVSPWANQGATASEMATGTIIWLIIMQVAACGFGGYLTGRLRTKWVNVHTDEVFFRDTAHGFLVWAVALVISASFLASAGTSIVGGAARAGAAGIAAGAVAAAPMASNTAMASRTNDSNAYFVDSLFRSDATAPTAAAVPGATGDTPARSDAMTRAETGRIFARGLEQPEFAANDKAYLSKRVAAATGLSQADADKRVNATIAQAKKAEADAKQAADEARQRVAHGLLWVFLSLLIGAFCASFAATIGGRQRDHMVAVATR